MTTKQREDQYLKELMEEESVNTQMDALNYSESLVSDAPEFVSKESSVASSLPTHSRRDSDATTEYTYMPDGSKQKTGQGGIKHKKRLSFQKQELTPLTDLIKINPNLPTIDSKVENTPVITNLAKALARTPNMSTTSNTEATTRNGFGSVALDTIKTKALTFRMMNDRPDLQIRLKLFLPHQSHDPKPQRMIVFINPGTSMKAMIDFLEAAYPQNYLKGRIKQLCIADEDGDVDDDFPPMQPDQDISAMGVGQFYVDCRFDDDSDGEDDGDGRGVYKQSNTVSISDEKIINMPLPFSKEEERLQLHNSQLSEKLKQHSTMEQENFVVTPRDDLDSLPQDKARASMPMHDDNIITGNAPTDQNGGRSNERTKSIRSSKATPTKNNTEANHGYNHDTQIQNTNNNNNNNNNNNKNKNNNNNKSNNNNTNKNKNNNNNNKNKKNKKKKRKTKNKSFCSCFCCCNKNREELEQLDSDEEDEDDEKEKVQEDSNVSNQNRIGYHPPNYETELSVNSNNNNNNSTRTTTSHVSNRQFGMV